MKNETFTNRLTDLMTTLHMNTSELSRRSGVPKGQIESWIKHRSTPHVRFIPGVARVLAVTPSHLVGWSDDDLGDEFEHYRKERIEALRTLGMLDE